VRIDALKFELAEATARVAALEAELAPYSAGSNSTTSSSPAVEITQEIPKSFYEGLAECRQQMLVDRDRRIAALEAERDAVECDLAQARERIAELAGVSDPPARIQ
jgi:hypothetical protein